MISSQHAPWAYSARGDPRTHGAPHATADCHQHIPGRAPPQIPVTPPPSGVTTPLHLRPPSPPPSPAHPTDDAAPKSPCSLPDPLVTSLCPPCNVLDELPPTGRLRQLAATRRPRSRGLFTGATTNTKPRHGHDRGGAPNGSDGNGNAGAQFARQTARNRTSACQALRRGIGPSSSPPTRGRSSPSRAVLLPANCSRQPRLPADLPK